MHCPMWTSPSFRTRPLTVYRPSPYASEDAAIGATYEVWFVHDGLLYQVMTYRDLDDWFTQILNTWQFR